MCVYIPAHVRTNIKGVKQKNTKKKAVYLSAFGKGLHYPGAIHAIEKR
jgi:hypothetical protein